MHDELLLNVEVPSGSAAVSVPAAKQCNLCHLS